MYMEVLATIEDAGEKSTFDWRFCSQCGSHGVECSSH